MFSLILSESNMKFLKSKLMQNHGLGSAHASEAIAALCDFSSNIALKTELARHDHPPVANLYKDRFCERLLVLGYHNFDHEEFFGEFYELKFQDSMWLAHQNGDTNRRNMWYGRCQPQSVPFITISKRRKYCKLEWDCISIDPDHEAHVRGEHGKEMVGILLNLYRAVARGNDLKSVFDGSTFYGTIDNLSEESAYRLASYFFWFLSPWKIAARGSR
jgi:hypothetical protein